MVKRVPVIRIESGARRMWEVQTLMPGTIEDIVDRALALDEALVNVRKLVPFKYIRSMACILDGWHVRLIGEADDAEQWWRVRDVQAVASE